MHVAEGSQARGLGVDKDTLVFIRRGDEQDFENRSGDVVSCYRERGRATVLFKKGMRTYTYRNDKVAICNRDKTYVAPAYTFSHITGHNQPSILFGATRATLYRSDNPAFEDRMEVAFADGTMRYLPASEVLAEPCERSTGVMPILDYLAYLAELLSTVDPTGNPAVDEYLVKKFHSIDDATVESTASRCMA